MMGKDNRSSEEWKGKNGRGRLGSEEYVHSEYTSLRRTS